MDINLARDEIAERLQLDEEASRDAHAGVPPPDAASPGGFEVQIMAAAREEGQKYIGRLDQHCRYAEDELKQCEEVLEESKRKRQQAIAVAPPDIDSETTKRAQDNAIAAYNKFKSDNSISRDATGDDRVTQSVWALVAAIAEGALNSYFFAPASGHGVLGGFATAILIGVVNVAFAFWGGVLGLRYAKNHHNPAANLAGLVWFFLCMTVCLAMVSLATLYRVHIEELKAADLDSSLIAAQASERAIAGLFAMDGGLFGSVDSIILFFLGALCAMFGVWKGYEYDDSYPGFGAMWRQMEEAKNRHAEAADENRERIQDWKNNYGGGMRQALSVLQDATSTMRTKARAMYDFRDQTGDAAHLAAELASGLLRAYRVKNQQLRGSAPPAYFAQYPDRKAFTLLDKRGGESRRRAEALYKKSEELLKGCDEEIRVIRKFLELP